MKNKESFTLFDNKYLTGFTLFEMLIVTSIMLLLVTIATPNFMCMRTNVQKNMCISNLRQIKLAKEQWALENNKISTDMPTAADLQPYLKDQIWDSVNNIFLTGHQLICPLDPGKATYGATIDSSYSINAVGQDPTCKISSFNHNLWAN